ncbi:MAG: hypothetical protein EPO08_06990 [Rhodospirillaceae bacterium]|nr:MAG: hypothetical protein EPO08_06990 [Rhodospirillaceae bacterium]
MPAKVDAIPALVATAHARDKPAPAPIGYGGPRLRLFPIMVPYRTSGGVLYQPLVIEVELAGGGGPDSLSEKGDAREKQACWALPIIHEKLLMYLFNANLVSDDFVGERRDVLTKNLFDVLIDTVGRGYYAGLTLVADDAAPLDSKSLELSKQCR